jgi:hypothetical protein
MRKTICILCSFAFFYLGQSQDRTVKELLLVSTRPIESLDSNGWKLSGTFILNLNQGTLSNWVAGGEQNVLGINSILNYGINFRHGKNTWDNFFDLALGFQNATSFGKFRKIDDRIDITTKYGHQINHHLYAGLLANFNTQSLAGYDYSVEPNKKISNFLTPGKVILSPGFDFKTKTRFSLFFSPATIRWILKDDNDFFNVAKFGVDSAKIVNTEVGSFVTAKFSAALAKWVSYRTRLDLFSNYKRHPENVDVLMTNLLTMKFTKLLATNISLDLIYDDDVKKRLQLKEILGVGLTVKL